MSEDESQAIAERLDEVLKNARALLPRTETAITAEGQTVTFHIPKDIFNNE